MLNNKAVPIEIENFRELKESNFNYVDKTCLIEKVIEETGLVAYYTDSGVGSEYIQK